MPQKDKKNKKSRPLPKPNRQIPNSLVRPLDWGSNPYLENARNYPIFGCWIMEGWQDSGITSVVVVRQQDNDRLMFGVYLIDYYCLGVKDAFTRVNYSRNHLERELPLLLNNAPVPCPVELAHELIYGALEYAQKIGFEPHPDFYREKADRMLDPAGAHPRSNAVVFGKDGKPFYISGPYDNEFKSKLVVGTLMRTCGLGNFDYVVSIGDLPDEMP